MTNAIRKAPQRFSPVLVLLLLCSVVIPAGAGPTPDYPSMMITQGIDPNSTNLSFNGSMGISEFTVTPTPIDLFHAELKAETLPGPRYMAFGPSVIGISIDPRVLAACFAIALIILVIWFVSFRNGREEKED